MSPSDPVDSFLKVVKQSLKVGIRQAAKLEQHRWAGMGAPVSQGGLFQICEVKKKKNKLHSHSSTNNGSQEKPLTLDFAVDLSFFINAFLRSLPPPFKSAHKPLHEVQLPPCLHCNFNFPWQSKLTQFNSHSVDIFGNKEVDEEEVNHVSFECFISDHLTPNLNKLDQENACDRENPLLQHPPSDFNHWKAFISSILDVHQVHANTFFQNLKFAKLGGVPPSSVIEASHWANPEGHGSNTVENSEDMGRMKSPAPLISSIELMEHKQQNPDINKLSSAQDFIKYTEEEGRLLFEELDRDGDGQVTLEDLKVAMRMRKLPPRYAHEFMSRTRSHFFSKSFGWKQLSSVIAQKEPTILRAYTSLCLAKSGTWYTKSEILESLKNAGLPATEHNAVAMMQFLNADTIGSISYRHFRSFMLLLPPYHLQKDLRSSAVSVSPPVEKPAESVLISALAGGLSCAMSCALMHPVDTIKTQVQASTLTLPQIISKLPQIGARGLYMGSILAILGQFSSHGLRTGISEAIRLVLIKVAPTLPNFQMQSITSFSSTFLGTAARIPCEVLKQQLQVGLYENVGEATVGIWRQDGVGGFFRGTVATLCREIPFYVVGSGFYHESKKVVKKLVGRELRPWETVAVGATCGGFTAVMTTPLDVIKTRMMTGQGQCVSATQVILSILCHEGPLGLYKGAVPRFFWVLPLGAFNFAGYELAKKAITRIINNEE